MSGRRIGRRLPGDRQAADQLGGGDDEESHNEGVCELASIGAFPAERIEDTADHPDAECHAHLQGGAGDEGRGLRRSARSGEQAKLPTVDCWISWLSTSMVGCRAKVLSGLRDRQAPMRR